LSNRGADDTPRNAIGSSCIKIEVLGEDDFLSDGNSLKLMEVMVREPSFQIRVSLCVGHQRHLLELVVFREQTHGNEIVVVHDLFAMAAENGCLLVQLRHGCSPGDEARAKAAPNVLGGWPGVSDEMKKGEKLRILTVAHRYGQTKTNPRAPMDGPTDMAFDANAVVLCIVATNRGQLPMVPKENHQFVFQRTLLPRDLRQPEEDEIQERAIHHGELIAKEYIGG
jgi:hypothetical protein